MCGSILAILLLAGQFTQASTGEVHLTISDAGQLPLIAAVELVSDVNQVHEQFASDGTGLVVAKRRLIVELKAAPRYAASTAVLAQTPHKTTTRRKR